MKYRINSEDFDLTDAIKEQVEEKLNKIASHMRNEAEFDVFLSKSGHQYEVKIETAYQQQKVLGESHGDEFYSTLTKAKKAALRQIDDLHDKRVTSRH